MLVPSCAFVSIGNIRSARFSTAPDLSLTKSGDMQGHGGSFSSLASPMSRCTGYFSPGKVGPEGLGEFSYEVPQRPYSRRSQISGPTATFPRTEQRIKIRKPLWPITCPRPTIASDRAQARSKCAERASASAKNGPPGALSPPDIGDRPSRRAKWRSAHLERACARSRTSIQTAVVSGAIKSDIVDDSNVNLPGSATRGLPHR